jgi:hypothetical protein
MPIRRKDGSIYKLRGPNKLLIGQHFWQNDEEIVLHNFGNLDVEVVETEKFHIPQPALPATATKRDEAFDASQLEQILDTISQTTDLVDDVTIEPEPEPEPEPEAQEGTLSPFRTRERHMLYCLPAKATEHKDDLYEERIIHIDYQSPFKFQSAIVDSNDIKTVYWTTVKQVTSRSILFHPERRRWWRVSRALPCPSGDGTLLECVPSDIKPDFSAASP